MRIIVILCAMLLKNLMAFQTFPQELKRHYLIPQNQALSAKNYILIDVETGTILTQRNPDEKIPPASLTKMMAIQLVAKALEKGSITLEDQVRVSRKAAKTPGSRMFLEPESVVSVLELISGSIVTSGNDATVALAEYISGSEDEFVSIMNQTAKSYGMNDSHFITSTGLGGDDHYSTATDLARLAIQVTQLPPDLYAIYHQKYLTHNDIKQSNRNRLLWRDESVDGIKSGHTSKAGYCLATSGERNGMRLVGVVLNTANPAARDRDSQKLLDYGFRFFEKATLFDANATLTKLPIMHGTENTAVLQTKRPIKVIIPRGSINQVNTEIITREAQPLTAPIDPTQPLADLVVTLHDHELGRFPLHAQTTISRANWFKRQWQNTTYYLNSWIESCKQFI